jgi:hypothetical protein
MKRHMPATFSLFIAFSLLFSGCTSFLPKPQSSSEEAITGKVSGDNTWQQMFSIISIVNSKLSGEEKKILRVAELGIPGTSNRGATVFATYVVHIFSVPGSDPTRYDQLTVSNRELSSYRRIISALFELSFKNISNLTYVTIIFFWPDGNVTVFGISKSTWEEVAAGKKNFAETLGQNSIYAGTRDLLNLLSMIRSAGLDEQQFLNFALQLALQQNQKRPQKP